MDNVKPTFNQNVTTGGTTSASNNTTNTVSSTTTTTQTTTYLTDADRAKLAEERRMRPENGVIWTRRSRNNTEFLSINLRMTRSQIQNILSKLPVGDNSEDIVPVEFVAFPNPYSESNPRRPAYRIYESKN